MSTKGKLWRQIIILVGILVGVSLLFLFVAFPLLVKITGNANSGRNKIVEERPLPQAPIFDRGNSVINESEFTLSGYAISGGRVSIVLNGVKAGEVGVGSDGRFSTNLHLDEGDNSIYATVVDENDVESASSNRYLVTLDTVKPTLTFDQEPSSSIVGKNNRQLTLNGETEPESKIYVNDALGRVDESGHFTLTYYLSDGDNSLHIVVVDKASNTEEVTLGINFKP